mmetsp:Transcript_133699/g.427478  ORF Transcript_133699/g.427478 Transcript_133699/m.427478 type:complete len:118 (+) Transcript_133699:312-665(+)
MPRCRCSGPSGIGCSCISSAPSYINLATSLGAEGRAAIAGADPVDRQVLLLQAIGIDPECAMAYMNLGLLLPSGAKVQLPSGQILTAPDLIATAKQLDPTCGPDIDPSIAAAGAAAA